MTMLVSTVSWMSIGDLKPVMWVIRCRLPGNLGRVCVRTSSLVTSVFKSGFVVTFDVSWRLIALCVTQSSKSVCHNCIIACTRVCACFTEASSIGRVSGSVNSQLSCDIEWSHLRLATKALGNRLFLWASLGAQTHAVLVTVQVVTTGVRNTMKFCILCFGSWLHMASRRLEHDPVSHPRARILCTTSHICR